MYLMTEICCALALTWYLSNNNNVPTQVLHIIVIILEHRQCMSGMCKSQISDMGLQDSCKLYAVPVLFHSANFVTGEI